MPAPPSSPIDPALGHLVRLAADAAGEQPGLAGVLARVTDPRHRRGVRHRLTVILGLALCAVVAGARPFTAIAEWAADADGQTLHVLGVTGAVPSESTFRRTPRHLDADAFDDLAGAWAQQATLPGAGEGRVTAVDGRPYRLGQRRKPRPSPAGRPRSCSRRRAGPGGSGRQGERSVKFVMIRHCGCPAATKLAKTYTGHLRMFLRPAGVLRPGN